MTPTSIGRPVNRVDGRQKVTGAAPYAAEFPPPRLAHAALVRSTIASGRIASIDTSAAERAPGVLTVITHRNAPRLAYRPHKAGADPKVGERQTINCSIADLRLDVSRPGAGAVALELTGAAAYELQMQERYPAIPVQPFADG